MDKLRTFLDGNKTYFTAGLGIIIAVLGHFFGPFQVGTLEVPQIATADMFNLIWQGLMVIFLRKGVSNLK